MLKLSTTKQRSRAQERKIAKEVGGKVVKGSGCMRHAKGDVKMEQFLIEAKTTDAASYALTVETMNKVIDEGLEIGKEAILQLDFRKHQLRLAVVPWMNFQLMLDDTKLAMSQGDRIEQLENVIKILVYRLFEKETVEHTDEVWEYVAERLAAAAKDPTTLPNVDVRI